MTTQVLAIVLLAAAPQSTDSDGDLAELLASTGNITAERWQLSFDAETNSISLRSKQRIRATVISGSSGGGEQMYEIFYRFKIVPPVDERHGNEAQREFARCRDLARAVPQEEPKQGIVFYYPQTASHWRAVLQVRRAELRLREIPQYAFKSIYLVPTYETGFIPHPGDRLGEATARDIKRVFAMLHPLAATLGP